MKVLILAGGFGTRISEESYLKPKPMVEIGGKPILWHIMKIYSFYGFNDFVILGGYKQEVIKRYFSDFFVINNDVTFDFASEGKMTVHHRHSNDWRVTILDTGLNTQTGGRIKRAQEYVGNETFMVTYGDGVGNIDIKNLLAFHERNKKIGTITTYNFGQSKGVVDVDKSGNVKAFREKSNADGDLINIGFMVFEPRIFDYLDGDQTVFERDPMKKLSEEGQLMSFSHKGYWQCMDTMKEKETLENLWDSHAAPWKIWED